MMRNCDLIEYGVPVNLPSSTWQVRWLHSRCINTAMWSSQPNRASHTTAFSYLLVASTSLSSSSSIFLLLVHNGTIIAEHNGLSFLCIYPFHDHVLTPSTVYTEYSIH